MQTETRQFQTETAQILRLVIHSLYSNREIFLRELISNASDACEKLRFEAIGKPALLGNEPLQIELIPDPEAGTLTVKDNGIGMSREEVVENLGTIARSGTKTFLESLSGDQVKDAQLIGQFGVGFYSAFIVADRVIVLSKRADSEAVRWESQGEGSYELQSCPKAERGTEVILTLRPDDKEFLNPERLRHLVRRYSNHLSFPIVLRKGEQTETINQAQAFWTRHKSELKDEDYQAFYKNLTHDWEDSRAWAHHKVEGNLEYTSLLYLPKRAPLDLGNREPQHGIALYVKRVFIMDKATQLLPAWLRFMRGLVDSADLPLNVSRELLQNNRTVEKIKAALIKRSLDLLDDLAANAPAEYAAFWNSFGAVLKEGIIEDEEQQPRIAKLLRFRSTASASDAADVSLDAYIARMKPEQKSIYFITADTISAARNSPHLEGFRAKGLEVLLLTDRIDEWVSAHLREYDGKKLQSAARASDEPAIQEPERIAAQTAFKPTLERLTKALGAKIASARLSTQLTDSPACLVAGEHDMSVRMARMVKEAGQPAFGASAPIFEVNAKHPLIQRLQETAQDTAFDSLANMLFDQAVLADGGQLEDPALFVRRINQLIVEGLDAQPAILRV
jgi:molecular chaperone HtpG